MGEYDALFVGIAILIGLPFAIGEVAEWMEIDGLPSAYTYDDIMEEAGETTIIEAGTNCDNRSTRIGTAGCYLTGFLHGGFIVETVLGNDSGIEAPTVVDKYALDEQSWLEKIFRPVVDLSLAYGYGYEVLTHEKGFNLPSWIVIIFFGTWGIIVSLILYDKVMGGLPFT